MMKGPNERNLTVVLYLVTVLYMGAIFYLSSLHHIDQPGPLGSIPSVDKFEHASEYLVLGLLLALSFQRTPTLGRDWRPWALTLLIGILYAASDETHQFFVSGRTADLLDLLADTNGICFGSLLGLLFYSKGSISTGRLAVTPKGKMQDSEE